MSALRPRLAAALLLATAATGCKEKTEPLVPANVEATTPTAFNSTAGAAVAGAQPAVKVTSSNGTAVPDVNVVFAVTGGGGSLSGATKKTDADGIATLGGWVLGTVAGANTMTATVTGLTPVTFTATGVPGAASRLAVTTAPSATAVNRAVLAVQPVVQVQDVHSNAVAQAGIVVTATSSVGSVIGTATATTNASGVATFTDIALAGTAGARTVTFSATGLTGIGAQVTTTAGVATALSINGGDGQAYFPSTAVPTPPSAKVADQDGNGVAGVDVTFAVTGGGGSVTGASTQSNASGIATVGSWTLGAAEGPNTMTASASGLTGSPVTFNATATNTPLLVSSVSPNPLTSGATATITGSGFSATPANNAVTIDGISATVTAASPTSLTVTVPSFPCASSHAGDVSVTTAGITSTKSHPIQPGTAHNLAVGGSVVLSSAASAKCNELHNAGASAKYYVSVYNTNNIYSTTGASFELKGSAGAASAIVPDASQTVRRAGASPRRPVRRPLSREQVMERNHIDFLERDLAFLRENAHRWKSQSRTASLRLGGSTAYAVGDAVSLRMRDISQSSCAAFVPITGRVAYVGNKGMIIEDNANPIAGTIDTTYAQIGSEFDSVMWPILEEYYGNALINDAVLDNNGKFIMVFSDKVRSLSNGGIAGFVTSCDLFERNATNQSSNFGEYFYATSPTMSGDISCTGSGGGSCNSPPRWRWSMRSTIIHEVKHIVSIAERFAKSTQFEVSWLEETTARLAEELYERERYGFAQKSNIGYGSAGSPVGPYCGVRLACGQARGIVRVFEELGDRWYQNPPDYSPIGRIDPSDFSFYATGWSLIRWALDNSATAEATILKNMTQHPTLAGIENFDANMGMTYQDALGKWSLAMVVDDYPGVTIADQTFTFPSWNLRNVFAGYHTDFNSQLPGLEEWPLVPLTAAFGSFTRTASVRPGTAAIIELSGTQAAKQVIELKASGSAGAAPTELRMSIVRVQ